jgi:hypothetical protein
MKLRLSHFPQVPCKPFMVGVDSLEEALKIADVLASYDLFQFGNNIKPEYCNMTILEQFDADEQEWCNWEDENGYRFEDYELKCDEAVLI